MPDLKAGTIQEIIVLDIEIQNKAIVESPLESSEAVTSDVNNIQNLSFF